MLIKKIILGGASLSMAACASTPYAPTLYDRDMAQVETIMLVGDPLPDQVIAAEGATDGANITSAAAAAVPLAGLFVAAAAAGVAAKAADIRHDKIDDALAEAGYDHEAVFLASMTAKLAEQGYAVAVDDETERKKHELLEEYEGVASAEQADAYLDVVASGFGFQRAGKRADWRPVAFVDVRLVSAEDGTTLLDHKLRYNPLGDQTGTISIDPDPAHSFASIDEFTEDPARLAAALDHVTDVLTGEIAGLLE